MATSLPARVVPPPANWLDLPTLAHPQYVNEAGYELDEPEVEEPVKEAEGDEEVVEDAEEKPDMDIRGDAMDVDVELGEPLLSVSDSLVLVQSLKQSRQRHMQRLFPLIFTHPPLPSYQKPRARGPPKSTFLYPTPAAPTAPLPYREYHGPRKADPADASSPGTPKGDDGKSTSAIRSQARAKRAAELDEVAPAHETECIARVTVTIGPFSYPETELWIGRFVEPRAEAAKVVKAEKRARVEQEMPKKRPPPLPKPLINPTTTFRPPPLPRPVIPTTARPAARPPPIPTTARPGPSSIPANAAPRPAEGAINPELIKKVNLAAATRPWLSDIIHKAARKQASKEELARLGRAVGRLNRGEDVDHGEVAPVTGTATPASAVPARLAAGDGTSRSSSPLTSEEDSELSDVEGDEPMKGPKQVGGGPVSDTPVPPPQAHVARPTSPQVQTQFSHLNPSTVTPQSRPPPPRPTPIPSASLVGTLPRPPPSYATLPSASSSTPTSSQWTPAMPPPAPRPVYAKVPPFLFLAFKDAPTEKYLIPLGPNSFISRAGGDHVTHPPPLSRVQPLPVVVPTPAPAAPVPPTAPAQVEQAPAAAIAAKLRTRGSLGAKLATPAVKEEPRAKALTPEPVVVDVQPDKPHRPIAPPPAPGTVVVSTLMSTGEWEAPDWDVLEKGLPWVNSVPASSLGQQVPSSSSPFPSATPIPGLANPAQQPPSVAPIPPPRSILNLGAIDFAPAEGDLQPTTVKLGGIDDHAWFRMKQVIDIVEMTELGALGRREPNLLLVPEGAADAKAAAGGLPSSGPPPVSGLTAGQLQVRQAYFDRQKARFARLLSRAPTRTFLRLRTEYVDSALIESTTDKWGPRPYSITTKSLYTRSPPPDDENEQQYARRASPEKPAKKRKSNANEPAVAFEMPVSLDALDEMVEEGAKFAIGRRGKAGRPKGSRKSVGSRAGKGRASDAAEEGAEGQKKGGWVRGKMGAVCEGCASTSLKVWRKGPGGRGTLCKDCGDAYAAGTLGELKAPGAMSVKTETPRLDIQLGERVADEQPGRSASAGEAGMGASLAAPAAAEHSQASQVPLPPAGEPTAQSSVAGDAEGSGGGMIVD